MYKFRRFCFPLGSMFIRLFFALLITSAVNTTTVGQEKGANLLRSLPQNIETVSLCELAQSPFRFNKKIVRIRATLVANHAPRVDGGDPFLFDLSCYSWDTLVLVESQPEHRPEPQILKALRDAERKRDKYENSRIDVTLIGRYDAPNGVGYGHLGWARSRILIMRYEEVKPVLDSIPWHWQLEEQAAPLSRAEEQIRQIDSMLQFYIMGERANAAEVRQALAEDYVLVLGENRSRDKGQMNAHPTESFKESSCRIETIRIYGNAAIVTGYSKRCIEKENCEGFSYMNVYVKRNDTWQAAASHLVPVK
jgi:hypothetical protein